MVNKTKNRRLLFSSIYGENILMTLRISQKLKKNSLKEMISKKG
jgi:hypothetical protein